MTDITTFGLVPLCRLMEGFIDSGSAKFATLWFDVLLFEDFWSSPNVSWFGAPKDRSFADWMMMTLQAQGARSDTIHYLQERWRGIFDAHQERALVFAQQEPLPSEITLVITETVREHLTQPLTHQRVHPLDIEKESSAAISNTTDLVARALSAPIDTTILAGMLAQRALAAIGTSLVRKPDSAAHIMLCSQVPDFSSLSWDDVAQLCHHRYYDAFRARMRELQQLREARELHEMEKLCHDIFCNSLKHLARVTRPVSLGWTLAEGVLGNTTPLGWLFSGRSAAIARRIEREHGWIYFVLDIDEVARTGHNQPLQQTGFADR